MADMDELEIKIDAEGNVTIKVIGGGGPSCVELTKELEEALGLVDKRELTADYHQDEEVAEETVEQEQG